MTTPPKRAHFFQHVAFEGPGSTAAWVSAKGMSATTTRFYDDPRLPEMRDVDLLVVLGGPCSVNDEAELPWLVDEKRFIRRAIESGKPVVGVCLGAQLIASAMGARVFPNGQKEIGWFPVQMVHANEERSMLTLPESFMAFHWHGETFELPQGAVHIARSAACENQGFQLGERAIGLQFHLEATPGNVQTLVTHCRGEIVPSPYIQREEELLSIEQRRYDSVNALMDQVLDYVTRIRA
jgi:GMP synthase-like glutamine amidotransferase